MNEEDIVYRLRKRAEIRRQITDRKSVQEGRPDRIADLLEEAADALDKLKNALEPQTPVKESFHKEWIGLDKEMMRNTTLQFNQGALWAERYLKEKNT
jgi:hypothetical protein